jgi:transcriptional regulator with XRE-family HTH domain
MATLVNHVKKMLGLKSNVDLATLLEVNVKTLAQWIRGKTQPSEKSIQQLAELIGAEADAIQAYLDGKITLARVMKPDGAPPPPRDDRSPEQITSILQNLSTEDLWQIIQRATSLIKQTQKPTIGSLIQAELAKPNRSWSRLVGQERLNRFAEEALLEPEEVLALLCGTLPPSDQLSIQLGCLARILTKGNGDNYWSLEELYNLVGMDVSFPKLPNGTPNGAA